MTWNDTSEGSANELAVKLNDNESLLVTSINIGLTHRLLNEFEEAESHLNRALNIAKGNKDKLRESLALVELGDVAVTMGNTESAYEYYNKSLEIKYDLDDKKGIASILATIASVQYDQGNLKDAKQNFSSALEKSEQLGLKRLTFEIHKFLSRMQLRSTPALKLS